LSSVAVLAKICHEWGQYNPADRQILSLCGKGRIPIERGTKMAMILIVDDDPMIRVLVEVALQQEGFSVLTADSGKEAISLSQLHRGEIGLLITDVMMPGMDGPALARKMVAERPDLPVLFMSGQSDPSDIEPYPRSEFLAKPFSLAALLAQVRSLLCDAGVPAVS
jgi:two-component system cell cycle sensor histidine kinase/response regulator CckA